MSDNSNAIEALERGERVKSFVVLKPGQAATVEELLTFCRENLAASKKCRGRSSSAVNCPRAVH